MDACPCVFEGDRQGKTVESTELIVDTDELDWQ
jgi:hypothetical protein